jgi:hypothetical protein
VPAEGLGDGFSGHGAPSLINFAANMIEKREHRMSDYQVSFNKFFAPIKT